MSRIDYELYKSVDSPGPGNYDMVMKPATPSYSLQGKRKPAKIQDNPGPGAYEPVKPGSKTPKTSFIGKAKRKELSQVIDSPGPGTYNTLILKKSPSWSLHGPPSKQQTESILGPGRYDLTIPKSTSMCITPRSPRPELFTTAESPGPGQYAAKSPTFNHTTYSFGKSARPTLKSDTPGPGQYQPNGLKKSVSYKFTKETKKTLTVSSDTPSAIYDPKILMKTPSYSFGVKVPEKIKNHNPGPGSYGNIENQPKIFTHKTTKSARFQLSYIEKEILEKPGPGRYELGTAKGKIKSGMGKAERFPNKANDLPGPGQYNPIKI